MVEHLADWID
uniref:Uncharacterized protein n=1 Tax=Oryza rufipogon TaxID=4529 RepID=A0A0G2KBR6_ORYRU